MAALGVSTFFTSLQWICVDKVLHAVSRDDKTLKDINVEPKISCTTKAHEDTRDVSIVSCVDKAMKDTHVIHDKALEDEILKDIHGEPEISFVNEKTLEDIHVVSTISCVDKVMEDTHVDIEMMEEMPKNEVQQESQIMNKRKIINEMVWRKKIFVGGLPSGISEEEFKNYFERFGTITDVVVIQDSVTHRPRGFGFITFDSEKLVENVMLNSFHDLNGKIVEVKRVVPKLENNNNGAFDQLKSNYGKGTSLKSFPYYYGTNSSIPIPDCGPSPWYQNNGLYFHAPNSYDWYPIDASFPWHMPMVPMTQPCPHPFGYCFPSYPYVGGNDGVKR
ncbi:RNA-binding protein 1-like [Glycine soja]|uniref:RNA-binding protein 1 n=2 Tax=Glycine subgen. Soja TaxID=1462606 RepID=A0A445GAT1_GLYSO|nr:RNA-binding protein 1-like [Glycine soja]RZB58312.1 RNA-binding protein 1 [Glycine soja]